MGCNGSSPAAGADALDDINSDFDALTPSQPTLSEDDATRRSLLGSRMGSSRYRMRKKAMSGGRADPTFVPQSFVKTPSDSTFIKAALMNNLFSDVFDEFEEAELARFIDCMEEVSFEPGTEFITQGDVGDFFYVIKHGMVEFFIDGHNKRSSGAGVSFGELALIFNAPRSATARAAEATTVWRVDHKSFRHVMFHAHQQACAAKAAALGRIPTLATLTEDQRYLLAEAVFETTCEEGEILLEAGESVKVTTFFIVKTGQVRFTSSGDNFQPIMLGPGDFFGERALLKHEPRHDTVVTTMPTVLYTADVVDLQNVLGPIGKILRTNMNKKVLQSMPCMDSLTEAEISKIVEEFREQSYSNGDTIMKQGEVGDTFHIMMRGRADVFVDNPDGTRRQINSMEEGDFFGEMALLEDGARTATVVANGPVENLVLTKALFTKVVGSQASFQQRVKNEELGAGGSGGAPTCTMPKGQLQTLTQLGVGTFGSVFLVRSTDPAANEPATGDEAAPELYALKVMNKRFLEENEAMADVMREIEVMSKLDSPFVVHLTAVFDEPQELSLLLDFVQGGELFSVIHGKERDYVSIDEAMFYGANVVLAMEHIHSCSVVYRDLKPENLLIDTRGYIKVIDFGFARSVASGERCMTTCGTPEYLAPEIVLGRGYSYPIDWWAVGILMYEMTTGDSPFMDWTNDPPNTVTTCRNIINANVEFPPGFDQRAKDLIRKFLNKELKRRLRAPSHIKAHPFWAEVEWGDIEQKRTLAPWVPTPASAEDASYFGA